MATNEFSPPFGFEDLKDDSSKIMLKIEIFEDRTEGPIPNTNVKLVELYQNERPDICQETSDLNNIDFIDSENNNISNIFNSKECKTTEKENEVSYLPSYED
ncbi:hypothetical protein C1645_878142 [Glomus cerebriforme]|uniref:Uncharacterized protein n=1 Tax=Glomus cerebriforme TaxID=658196 RepID=A0A397STK4_9GLOM|nr:hypothetical protein C1645_878142 [Glomus cerebriforme]